MYYAMANPKAEITVKNLAIYFYCVETLSRLSDKIQILNIDRFPTSILYLFKVAFNI